MHYKLGELQVPLAWTELHSTKILVCWSVFQKLSKWRRSVMSRLQSELESLLNLWERAGFKNGQHLSGAPVLALHRVLNIIEKEGRGNSSKGCVCGGGRRGCLTHIFSASFSISRLISVWFTRWHWHSERTIKAWGMIGLCSGEEGSLHTYDPRRINNHTKCATSILHNISI